MDDEREDRMRALEVGVSGLSRPPVDVLVPACRGADEAGFDAVWWADHFLHWYPPSVWTPDLFPQSATDPTPHTFLDPAPLMGAVAATTGRVQLGVCVTDAIRRHPAVLAQTYATIDLLSHGRARLGLGVGEAENIVPYGLPYDRTASRLIEAAEVIRLLWSTHEPVSYAGEFFRLDDAILGVAGHDGGRPELWMPAHRPRVLGAAARLADGWMPILTDPAEYARLLADLRAGSVAAGRPEDAVAAGLYAWIVCDEDRDRAEALLDSLALRFVALTAPASLYERHGAEHPLASRWGLLDFVPTRVGRDAAVAAARAVPDGVLREYYMWGTPDDVVDRLRPFREAGMEAVNLTNMTAAADPSLAAATGRRNADILAGLRRLP
ncbi:MAG: LLM class flavin-dependent oxidoreductase [Thermoleophilia bacterium]